MRSLVEAIDRLIEANAALRKRRSLAKPERKLALAMARAFRAEERAFLSRLKEYSGRFPSEVREAEAVPWELLFDEAAADTMNRFEAALNGPTEQALQAGMDAGAMDLAVDATIKTSFTLKHPDAVQFIKEHGADRIKRIRQTTRDGLRSILAQAADEGWSYDRTAEAIRKRYKHMSVERGRNIAVFELGDAYEHGNMLVGKSLQNAGLEMQKSWLTVGDSRVRPEHSANQAQSWIPFDDAFANDGDRPPSDPRCRCTLLMRRKPDA